MIDDWTIQKEIREKLFTINTLPDKSNRAWENVNFTPNDNTPWIRETVLPGNEFLSANDELEANGIIQYDYFVPVGGGAREAKEVAATIKKAFAPGTTLKTVRITRSRVLTGRPDGAWYQLPVQIFYQTFSTNS